MKPTLVLALALAAPLTALLALLYWAGIRLAVLLGLLVLGALAIVSLPWLGVRSLDALGAWWRSQLWRQDDGHFHSFGGVRLRIEDDGRHMWVDGAGLQRALGRREPDDALAARHTGRWRRTAQGVLMLRVDAVVQQLASQPGREDLRVQRLRRYLERDVLYPAARRRH